MPFCPQCNAEYKSDVLTCSDCQVQLVPEPIQIEITEYGDWCVVESVPNELAANILQGVLEEEGIPVYLRCHDVPYHPGVKGSPTQSEWGDVLVPNNLLPQAQKSLKTYFDSLQEV